MKNRKIPLILGVLLFGLVLRCWFLAKRGIWYDDAFSIFLSQQDFPAIVNGTAADTMPPLYYFVLHLFLGISCKIWWLRILNVSVSLGNIYLLYRIVRYLAGDTAGLVAALLAAISPIHIYHAQELRMYTFLVFGQLLYTWFFIKLWYPRENGMFSRHGWLDWAGLILGGVIAMYSHNLAIFTLIVPDIILLIRRDWRGLFRLFFVQVAVLAVASPWLLLIPGQVDKIQKAFWTPRPGIVEIIQAIVVFVAAIPLPGIWQSVGILISIEVFVFLIWGIFQKHSETKLQTSVLLAYALCPPLMMFVVSYFMRPIFVPRGFLFSSLALFGLAGLVFKSGRSRISGWFVAGGFILASAISLPYQTMYDEFPRSPYQEAMELIKPLLQPGDIVIHDNKLSYFPSEYYAPDIPQRFLMDEPGSHNDTLAIASQEAMGIYPEPDMSAAIGDSDRIFFVVYDKAIEEYLEMGEPDHPQLSWLEQNYALIEKWHVGDLGIYLYSGGA